MKKVNKETPKEIVKARDKYTVHSVQLSNKKVFKKNDLINAHYTLSLMEQKLICIFACMVSSTRNPFNTTFEITAREFCQLVGLKNTNNYPAHIRKVIKKLLDRQSFTIGNTDFNWISSATYYPTGIIEFEFPTKLIPYLQSSVKGFYTKYFVSNVLLLEHQHSPRLYELCKQYRYKKQRIESVDEWKRLLGIPENKYKRTYDFIKKVIKPAEMELYRKTDIGITHFIANKKGKEITHIGFNIYSGKGRPDKSKILKDTLNAVRVESERNKDSNLHNGRLDEYYRDLQNFPDNNKPTFDEYLEFRGMRRVKSKVTGIRWDIKFIEGTQGQIDFLNGKRARMTFEDYNRN